MRIDGDGFHEHERAGEAPDSAMDGWVKRWNNWDGLGALECCCGGAETNLPFVSCCEKIGYERRLAELLDVTTRRYSRR